MSRTQNSAKKKKGKWYFWNQCVEGVQKSHVFGGEKPFSMPRKKKAPKFIITDSRSCQLSSFPNPPPKELWATSRVHRRQTAQKSRKKMGSSVAYKTIGTFLLVPNPPHPPSFWGALSTPPPPPGVQKPTSPAHYQNAALPSGGCNRTLPSPRPASPFRGVRLHTPSFPLRLAR